MKSYSYVARDLSGLRKEGFREAVCSNDVLAYLREQEFTPVSVNEVSVGVKQTWRIHQRKRIKSSDMSAIFWQLRTMVEGGIALTTALESISEDMENLQLKHILQQVLEKVNKGETLSDSISKFPKVFNRLSCAIILAGETGGSLPVALQRLAEYFDNRDKLAKKVKAAMAYPCFVFTFIALIVIFIMTFIVPRFTVIFEQLGGDLPAFTKAFMWFYDGLRYNVVYIIGSVLLLIIFGVVIFRTKKGHYLFSRIVLGLPLVGKIFSQSFVAVFCRTMSTLIASGVSVLEVFDILAAMSNNDIIKGAMVRTRERIVAGLNISLSLSESGFFPNMVAKMVQVGEESGSLAKVLDRTANYYERKVDSTITTVLSLLEPMMIVTVGAIVLVVVIAMYLPIFSMTKM